MTYSDLLLYAIGSDILVITPGPALVAIMARAASRDVRSSVPLALGGELWRHRLAHRSRARPRSPGAHV